MTPTHVVDLADWSAPFATDAAAAAVAALESGQVLLFPHLGFPLVADEASLLSPQVGSGARKNITFDPLRGTLGGIDAVAPESPRLTTLLRRYSDHTAALVRRVSPSYADGMEVARTTFRPNEIKGRTYDSPKKDDRWLHVDAFPSRPTQGRRILRVFTNINPHGEPRAWEVGEPFEAFAKVFLPRVRKPNAAEAWLLASLGITKGRRSAYDQLMMGLHDRGKLDADYQKSSPHFALQLPPQTTWMCFTDQVLHAALAGRYALEQTFHIAPDRLVHPDQAPLRVLERLQGRTLV